MICLKEIFEQCDPPESYMYYAEYNMCDEKDVLKRIIDLSNYKYEKETINGKPAHAVFNPLCYIKVYNNNL